MRRRVLSDPPFISRKSKINAFPLPGLGHQFINLGILEIKLRHLHAMRRFLSRNIGADTAGRESLIADQIDRSLAMARLKINNRLAPIPLAPTIRCDVSPFGVSTN